MKLIFKEDPKEWRKSALLTVLGLAMVSSLLRWRRHLPPEAWPVLLAVLAAVALCALLQPRWFRGWYRLSLRLGFYSSQFISHCVLVLFFFLLITPLGIVLRLAGKEPLQLKPAPDAKTHWQQAKQSTPLDQLY